MGCATATKAPECLLCSINTTSSNENIGMQQLIELSTAPEPFDSSAGTLDVPDKNAPGSEPRPVPLSAAAATKTMPVQIVLIVLGVIAFLYFARPVVLPVFLACMAGMTLKPLIRWSSCCHLPPDLNRFDCARRHCLSLLRPSRGLAGLPGLHGGDDPETAHPLVVLLPHSAGSLHRSRALPPGGRRWGWFLPIGPPGVDVDERSAATHDRVEATSSKNVPAHRADQSSGGGGE